MALNLVFQRIKKDSKKVGKFFFSPFSWFSVLLLFFYLRKFSIEKKKEKRTPRLFFYRLGFFDKGLVGGLVTAVLNKIFSIIRLWSLNISLMKCLSIVIIKWSTGWYWKLWVNTGLNTIDIEHYHWNQIANSYARL